MPSLPAAAGRAAIIASLCVAVVLWVGPVGSAAAQEVPLRLSPRQWQALDDSLANNPYYLALLPRDSAVALIQAAVLTRGSGLRWAAYGPGVCAAMERPPTALQPAEQRAAHRESYDCLASLYTVVARASDGMPADSGAKQIGAMLLAPLTETAVEVERLDEADSLAGLLLNEYLVEGSWMAGNIVHNANQVRGRVALRRGDVAAAREYLAAAGDTPGSPQLNSFGPRFTLARELLERGQTEAVLAYLGAVRRFWANPDAIRILTESEEHIRAGEIPTDVRWR
jgi:hypothetical protein